MAGLVKNKNRVNDRKRLHQVMQIPLDSGLDVQVGIQIAFPEQTLQIGIRNDDLRVVVDIVNQHMNVGFYGGYGL